MNIEVIDFKHEIASDLIDLWGTYYAESHDLLNLDFLNWFYSDNPTGTAKLVVATIDSKLVGVMALIPISFQNKLNKAQEVYFAANVLSHPEFRKHNIFIKLIRKAQSWLEQRDGILIGHPNDSAIPAWRRTKMFFMPESRLFFLLPALDLKSASVLVNDTDDLSALDDRLFKYNCTSTKSSTFGREFLQWRYLGFQKSKYEVRVIKQRNTDIGLVVYRKMYGVLRLVVHWQAISGKERKVLTSLKRGCFIFTHKDSELYKFLGNNLIFTRNKKKMKYFVSGFGQNQRDLAGEYSELTLAFTDL